MVIYYAQELFWGHEAYSSQQNRQEFLIPKEKT